MEKRKLILIGGGGHCKSCIDVILSANAFEIHGILDVKEKIGNNVLGYRIIDTDAALDMFSAGEYIFLITVGQIKSSGLRSQLYEKIRHTGRDLATVISANAVVSKHSSIGAGSVVMHGAKINAEASIGANCIINTNALIEHDCYVGDHTHISTGAILNGECKVGKGAFIGSASVLLNGVAVGDNIVVGAGAVVNRSLSVPGVYVGNPCRKISE